MDAGGPVVPPQYEGLPLDIFEYLPRSSREDCAMVGQLVQYFLHGRQSVQELADHDLRRGMDSRTYWMTETQFAQQQDLGRYHDAV